MPIVSSSGATISYDVHGPAGSPPVLFINSIGTRRELWDRQRRGLETAYRVIQYDARGHGQSSVLPGDYTITQLAQDALAILDAEQLAEAQICGIFLGGLTALRLGVDGAHRARAQPGHEGGGRHGHATLVHRRLPRARGRHGAAVPRMVESCPAGGYLGCCAALRDEDLREALGAVRCPVLAVAGSVDRATPAELLQFVHERIPRSRLVTLEAGHLSNVEQDAAFNASLSAFLAAHA